MVEELTIGKSKRNRLATTQRIIDVLEEVLTQQGLDGVSIQLIAEKALVSKVLIYRYFGGLEGLLEYYIKSRRLMPTFTSAWLEQLQPTNQQDLAPIWSAQTLHLFRQLRSSRAARELLKSSVQEKSELANVVHKAQDAELSRLVHQLAFIKGGDYQATSALLLGALSYLTIQAQLDRPVIGLDLRSETVWQRIEEAVKVIYKGLNRMANDSPSIRLATKPANVSVSSW